MKPISRRERVFAALGDGQKSAHDIAYAIGLSPVDVSNDLCQLRRAGAVRVVRSERVSKKLSAPAAHIWERASGGMIRLFFSLQDFRVALF